jgi:predicted component of type VI protein secretion system
MSTLPTWSPGWVFLIPGVVAAEFDDAALALSRLNAIRLVVRFQDGTIVDTDLADTLPPVCDLSVAAGVNLLRWLSHCRC